MILNDVYYHLMHYNRIFFKRTYDETSNVNHLLSTNNNINNNNNNNIISNLNSNTSPTLDPSLRYRHLIETVQPPNLWQPTDSFMSGIQRPYPANDSIDLNNYYPTQRTQTSPSGIAFPQLFTYVPPSFNHHLSSNVDDNSLLIPNPSLT